MCETRGRVYSNYIIIALFTYAMLAQHGLPDYATFTSAANAAVDNPKLLIDVYFLFSYSLSFLPLRNFAFLGLR